MSPSLSWSFYHKHVPVPVGWIHKKINSVVCRLENKVLFVLNVHYAFVIGRSFYGKYSSNSCFNRKAEFYV